MQPPSMLATASSYDEHIDWPAFFGALDLQEGGVIRHTSQGKPAVDYTVAKCIYNGNSRGGVYRYDPSALDLGLPRSITVKIARNDARAGEKHGCATITPEGSSNPIQCGPGHIRTIYPCLARIAVGSGSGVGLTLHRGNRCFPGGGQALPRTHSQERFAQK